jgi:ParB family chromosome partitioning protein
MASLTEKFKQIGEGKAKLGFDPLANDVARLTTLRIEDIEPDPSQPRKDIGDIEGLQASIVQHGILQPLIVSPLDANRYRLVAGERRFRAAQAAGLKSVPALVRTVEDHRRIQVQLVENMHRKDLNAFEEAEGYQRLGQEFSMTQEQIAQEVGKSRTHVTQTLSLMRIPVELRQECQTSDIPLSRDTLYLLAKQDSQERMRELLAAAKNGLGKEEQRERARKGAPRTSSGSKPKKVFSTAQEASVIVQSNIDDLSTERVIAALEEALRQAREQEE